MFSTLLGSNLFSIISLSVWFILSLLYCYNKWRIYSAISAASRKQPINTSTPPLSVVIPAHDQGDDLSLNLPSILEQAYENFEVIVVDDASTDNTRDVIELLSKKYKNLRHTFVPESARYVSRKKLSITLGVKAAQGEWVVLTRPDCQPKSANWLKSLSSRMTTNSDVVVGYANFVGRSSSFLRRAKFDRFLRASLYFLSILRKRPLGGDGCNLSFRRQAFFDKKCFSDNLNLMCGEDILLVKALADGNNVSAISTSESIVSQQIYPKNLWKSERLAIVRSFHNLDFSKRCALIGKNLALSYNSVYLLITIVLLAFRIYAALVLGLDLLNLILDVPLILMLFLIPIYTVNTLNRNTDELLENNFGVYALWYNFWRPFRGILFKFSYWAHKNDFIRR